MDFCWTSIYSLFRCSQQRWTKLSLHFSMSVVAGNSGILMHGVPVDSFQSWYFYFYPSVVISMTIWKVDQAQLIIFKSLSCLLQSVYLIGLYQSMTLFPYWKAGIIVITSQGHEDKLSSEMRKRFESDCYSH